MMPGVLSISGCCMFNSFYASICQLCRTGITSKYIEFSDGNITYHMLTSLSLPPSPRKCMDPHFNYSLENS